MAHTLQNNFRAYSISATKHWFEKGKQNHNADQNSKLKSQKMVTYFKATDKFALEKYSVGKNPFLTTFLKTS